VAVPVFYSARYQIDIGLHVFPTRKYQLVRDALAASPSARDRAAFIEPEPATWDELALVHRTSISGNFDRERCRRRISRSWSCHGRSRWSKVSA